MGDAPEFPGDSRQRLVAAHIIHDFDPAIVADNLRGCYGALMQDVYREMLPLIVGRRILDCGCGFGLFSRIAIDAGFAVTSIDIDDASLGIAREIFGIPCRNESVYSTTLPDGACDTAVCCDSIQHFDIDRFAAEMSRLGVRRVVVYDSNTANPLLGLYRRATGHEESHDRTPEQIAREFAVHGYEITGRRYDNIVALPLSGGLQRPPMLLAGRFPGAIRGVDTWLAAAARLLRIDRRLAFRFLLVLDRTPARSGDIG